MVLPAAVDIESRYQENSLAEKIYCNFRIGT